MTVEASVPVRPVTCSPGYHWFGYYDKLQFDPTGRYLLGMEADFEHRSPRPEDVIRVGMVDLEDGNRWTALGESRAWCWQQGCMLQWRPGSDSEILWNDREQDRFVCRILDTRSGARRTVPAPVYTVSPDGRTAFCPDFRRINDLRPGYGYCGIPDPNRGVRVPDDSGIWRVDLDTGEVRLIVTIEQVVRIGNPHWDMSEGTHYFNHLLVNPDGRRVEFLHRWCDHVPGFRTRMFTADPDGGDLRIVDDSGATSHFIWRDPASILAWSNPGPTGGGFYLFRDGGGVAELIGREVMTQDGHCSYLPGNEWILNDSYPDAARVQRVYIYHVPTGRRVDLAGLYLPPEYEDEWRCDLHPRFSPDGARVVVDSAHGGQGRQMHVLEIGDTVRREAT
ncbi:hypothetical protein ACFLSJ_02095 [Verrucomicrobiota bacterium]